MFIIALKDRKVLLAPWPTRNRKTARYIQTPIIYSIDIDGITTTTNCDGSLVIDILLVALNFQIVLLIESKSGPRWVG